MSAGDVRMTHEIAIADDAEQEKTGSNLYPFEVLYDLLPEGFSMDNIRHCCV